MRIFCSAKDSQIFSTKNNSIFCDIYFQNFNETLTNNVVNFEQPGPGVISVPCDNQNELLVLGPYIKLLLK